MSVRISIRMCIHRHIVTNNRETDSNANAQCMFACAMRATHVRAHVFVFLYVFVHVPVRSYAADANTDNHADT